ncbi:mandelate racemase/muconate lactonizing enzyme family protein [Caballeronia mineralivorans]|jgi:L-alanine-DL-glutamate epimerase-like enolase superfamily enzyme|uniref:mandelate racemase/muconate lactonizing enzyme family protein n=1 Tax=Caballeronia mineralivorans TaxID=2010198 RepID=UPI0023F3E999|nr:mandelate racemase/muconate lactonizing enzyme family protein [Caballeronia mineralivorans]MDB5789360.1 mandelate racemase/muconate lactonizing enzyme family protein [Caballeronia mineralivorans]
MKIASIESIPLRIPFTAGGMSDAAVWGIAGLQTVDSLIVKITSDTGVVGWGESFGFTAIPAVKVVIDSILAPEMIGRDATQLEKQMLDLQKKFHIFGRSGAFIYGLSAIDIALWDIAGKVARQPVYQLLGGSDTVSLPAYASLIRYSDPGLVRKNVRRALDSGFRHLKLHEIDIDCVRAAREAAGDDVEIMLDVNCPWSVREALDMTERLRSLKLRWLEEPVWPPENYSGLAQVRQQGGIPVAAGENASTLMDFQHLLEAKAVDFIQPSSAKMGGLTELRKVFVLANAHNVTVMVHTFYDGPGLLANVHASAALGGPGAMVEWRYFDLEAQLYGDAIIPKNGAIAVPQDPGLGLEPDADVISEFRLS